MSCKCFKVNFRPCFVSNKNLAFTIYDGHMQRINDLCSALSSQQYVDRYGQGLKIKALQGSSDLSGAVMIPPLFISWKEIIIYQKPGRLSLSFSIKHIKVCSHYMKITNEWIAAQCRSVSRFNFNQQKPSGVLLLWFCLLCLKYFRILKKYFHVWHLAKNYRIENLPNHNIGKMF